MSWLNDWAATRAVGSTHATEGQALSLGREWGDGLSIPCSLSVNVIDSRLVPILMTRVPSTPSTPPPGRSRYSPIVTVAAW